MADVADPAQVEGIADAAIQEFGRIDTWVNNAAVSMYGRITDLSIADMRRQMDINYWGQVYGSITAVRHLRARGGALINVGSALCDRAIPLQGNYCAAKHALKAFTDALRMELAGEWPSGQPLYACPRRRWGARTELERSYAQEQHLFLRPYAALAVCGALAFGAGMARSVRSGAFQRHDREGRCSRSLAPRRGDVAQNCATMVWIPRAVTDAP